MNDRYLFKAKRLDNGGWVRGSYLYDYGRNIHYIFANEIVCPNCINDCRKEFSLQDYEVDLSTICQCTGLKDKNGKLIWENDIILFQRDNDDCPFPNKDTKKRLGKVFYSDFRTTFAIGMGKNGSKSLNDDLWKYVQNGNRVEVIGNKFDTKDLLGKDDE